MGGHAGCAATKACSRMNGTRRAWLSTTPAAGPHLQHEVPLLLLQLGPLSGHGDPQHLVRQPLPRDAKLNQRHLVRQLGLQSATAALGSMVDARAPSAWKKAQHPTAAAPGAQNSRWLVALINNIPTKFPAIGACQSVARSYRSSALADRESSGHMNS
jgi:hypothetical protein